MANGCSVGDVFLPLSAEQKPEVTKAIGRGAGMLCIHGNHSGGIFNVDMAAETADMEADIRAKSVAAGEDAASAAPARRETPIKRGRPLKKPGA